MIKTIINEKNLDKADVILVSAPYEKTASLRKGTVWGPEKVAEYLDTQIEFFGRKFRVEVNDFVKIAHLYLDNLAKLSPTQMVEKIKNNAIELLEKNKFIFLLGGEHSVSIGVFQALAKKYKPKDVTILQIDAHCDLRENDSDYSKNPSDFAHSTVMRHASKLGYKIVQVGIRTYSKEEYEYFSDKKNNIKVFEWGLRDKPKIEKILKNIKTKYVYLTIDIDGFDPSVMPGTGTPVPDGLKWKYGVKLIEKLIKKFNLIGADIVEVSPIPDSVLTEYSAAQLCYTIIANKFQKKFKR
ncbi:MAG: agmatinase [Candidatus Paceibacterota bacterium]